MLAHLHIHFWVTAACFLGFNLKKRKMPNTLAYVAKTHCRGKKARSANDSTLVGKMCLIWSHAAHNSRSSSLWLCMSWSTWQSQWTGAGFRRRVLPWWMIADGPATRRVKAFSVDTNGKECGFCLWECAAWHLSLKKIAPYFSSRAVCALSFI